MKAWLKRAAHALLGDYGLYQIWCLDGPAEALESPPLEIRELQPADLQAATADAGLREAAWYFGEQAHGFGCFSGDQLLGLAFFWHGQRYAARHSWPIPARSAKLVHITTVPAQRGRGLAPLLIKGAAAQMQALGFGTLYARIWHSNAPSQKAFARAGWKPVGGLLQIDPLRRGKPSNLKLPGWFLTSR